MHDGFYLSVFAGLEHKSKFKSALQIMHIERQRQGQIRDAAQEGEQLPNSNDKSQKGDREKEFFQIFAFSTRQISQENNNKIMCSQSN